MRVVACELREVTRELAVAVGGAGHRTYTRRAIEARLRDDEGRVGRAELSPLPGYSSAKYDDVLAELRSYQPRVHSLDEVLTGGGVLECALLDLFAQRVKVPLWSLLRDDDASALPLSAILLGDDAQLANEAAQRRSEGYAVVKRKLGAMAPLQEIPRPLRLDGNRSWTLERLRTHARTLDALEPEMIEEPCDAPLSEAATFLRAPLAADESIAGPTIAHSLAAIDALADLRPTIVLKPSRDGMVGAMQLGRRAREHGMRVVVTHMWDGPIAHLAAAHVALALGEMDSPAQGLAPHPGLEGEHFDKLLVNGHLVPPRGAGLCDA